MTCFSKRFKVTGERYGPFEHQCGFTGLVRLRLPEALQESDTPLNGYQNCANQDAPVLTCIGLMAAGIHISAAITSRGANLDNPHCTLCYSSEAEDFL
jgi:hypothetical protein